MIIAVTGGIGNQMFQYAFYLKQQYIRGGHVKIDISSYWGKNIHNGYELSSVFNIDPQISIMRDPYIKGKFINGILRRLYYRLKSRIVFGSKHYAPDSPEGAITYFEKFLNPNKYNSAYLFGYWQSEKYFIDITNVVKEAFSFKKPLDIKNKLLAENIERHNSVSIHVRRGDYLTSDIFSNICTAEYYYKAIEKIERLVEKPKYYVFSNDIEWCKANLNLSDANYVDWNTEADSYKDMQLMSMCKHNIIANSTFSWWGAWLNNSPNKIVIMPNKWFNLLNSEKADIYPNGWIRI